MKIITEIQGGLGNQLFQYAMGKSLSHRYQRELYLDSSWFAKSWADTTPRTFLLPEFNLSYRLNTDTSGLPSPKKWRRIAQQILPINPYIIKDQHEYRYNDALLNLQPWNRQDIHLMGYWQSFRYFSPLRKQLLTEITPKLAPSSHYKIYAEKIHHSSSAMVHIRRGDYVHLKSAAKVHGFLGLDYYKTAMGMVLEENPRTQFFVFSDDMLWAKHCLPYQNKITFIESSKSINAPAEELYLMSQCKQHIIANSSLSWWGAWLSQSNHPLIICPSNWTTDHHQSWEDLLPQSWIKLNS